MELVTKDLYGLF